jgi:hypothetical protein
MEPNHLVGWATTQAVFIIFLSNIPKLQEFLPGTGTLSSVNSATPTLIRLALGL